MTGRRNDGPSPTRRQRHLLAGIWIAVAAIVAASVSIADHVAASERRHALEIARATLQRTAISMAAHAERVFADAVYRLDEGNALLAEAAWVQGAVDAAPPSVQARDAGAPWLPIVFVDAQGVVVAPPEQAGIDLSSHAFVRDILRGGGASPHLGAPVDGLAGGQMAVPAARRAAAREQGVALIDTAIPLASFVDLHARLMPQPRGAAALFREDGMLFARQPHVGSRVGEIFSGPLVAAFATGDSGVVEGIVQTDGVNRLIAFERVGTLPLFTAIAADRAAIIAPSEAKGRGLPLSAGLPRSSQPSVPARPRCSCGARRGTSQRSNRARQRSRVSP